MTTEITIDPALVREVLGIDDWEHEKYCDNAFRLKDEEPYDMVVTDNNIQFQNCCECYFEGLQGIEGATFLAEEPEVDIDIHRFKDMAIEWCVGKGWGIEMCRDEVNMAQGTIKVYRKLRILTICEEIFLYGDVVPRLSAELAAISFVWEQIQKEKKDEPTT